MYTDRDKPDSRLQHVGAFEKWLNDYRIDHSSVKIVESPVGAGLGLQAASALQVKLLVSLCILPCFSARPAFYYNPCKRYDVS